MLLCVLLSMLSGFKPSQSGHKTQNAKKEVWGSFISCAGRKQEDQSDHRVALVDRGVLVRKVVWLRHSVFL